METGNMPSGYSDSSGSSLYIYRLEPFSSGIEISNELGGNIFPVTLLSTATTDANLIVPADTNYLGNPKSCIAVRVKNEHANSKLRVEVAETPFFAYSVSEFILPESGKEYWVFPDIIWNYDALRENEQAVPVTVSSESRTEQDVPCGEELHTFQCEASMNVCWAILTAG